MQPPDEFTVAASDKNLALLIMPERDKKPQYGLLICLFIAIGATAITVAGQIAAASAGIALGWEWLAALLTYTPADEWAFAGWWHRAVSSFNLSIFIAIVGAIVDGLRCVGITANPSIDLVEFIAACVFAPVVEELQFRGPILWALNAPLARWTHYLIWPLIVGTTVLFTLGHPYPVVALPNVFAVAALSTWLTWRFRSLWPAILFHAIHNVQAVV